MSWFSDILGGATGWLDQNVGGYMDGGVGTGYNSSSGFGGSSPSTGGGSYDWSAPNVDIGGLPSSWGTADNGGSMFDSSTYGGSSALPGWMSSPNTTYGLDGFGSGGDIFDNYGGGAGGNSWWNSPNTYGDILADTGASFSNNDPAGAYATQIPSNPAWSWAAMPDVSMFGGPTDPGATMFTSGTAPAMPNQSSTGAQTPISSIMPPGPGMAPITGDTEPPGPGTNEFSDQEKRRQQQFNQAYGQTVNGPMPRTQQSNNTFANQSGVPGTAPAAKEAPGMNTKFSFGGMQGLGALAAGGLALFNMTRNTVPGQEFLDAAKSNIPQIQGLITNAQSQAASLRNSVSGLTPEGMQLMQYVQNGKLPPGLQAQLESGKMAAIAQAKSAAASRGQSADPNQNSGLMTTIQEIERQSMVMQGQIATQLYQAGLQAISTSNQTQQVAAGLENQALQAVGLSQNTYLALQKVYADQDKNSQAAIMNFANALGKMSGGKSA